MNSGSSFSGDSNRNPHAQEKEFTIVEAEQIPPHVTNAQPMAISGMLEIAPKVLDWYDRIRTDSAIRNQTKDVCLSLLQAKKVRPDAVAASLADYRQAVQCDALRTDITNVIAWLAADLPRDGRTRLFVCHNRDIAASLEFFCLAICGRVSKRGEPECDFALSTSSYSKAVDKRLLITGIALLAAAIGLGTLTYGASLGPAAILGTSSAVSAYFGAKYIAAGFDTSIQDDLKDVLEARFLYEIIAKGYARFNPDGSGLVFN